MVWNIALQHLQLLFQGLWTHKFECLFSPHDGNHSNKMSLFLINLLLSLLHILVTASPYQWCPLGTQVTTVHCLALLDSNKWFCNLCPCFFNTRIMKFIAVLVLIRKLPSHRYPDLVWDTWFIMRHNVSTCFHLVPISTLNSHMCWLKSSAACKSHHHQQIHCSTFTLSIEAYKFYSVSNLNLSD